MADIIEFFADSHLFFREFGLQLGVDELDVLGRGAELPAPQVVRLRQIEVFAVVDDIDMPVTRLAKGVFERGPATLRARVAAGGSCVDCAERVVLDDAEVKTGPESGGDVVCGEADAQVDGYHGVFRPDLSAL